jgi:hypothetical protein
MAAWWTGTQGRQALLTAGLSKRPLAAEHLWLQHLLAWSPLVRTSRAQ